MNTKILATALALAGVVLGPTAWAANSAQITVNATVQSKCSMSGSDTISLTIDPSAAGPIVGDGTSGAITYNCTKGVTPGTITFGSFNTGNTSSWQLKSASTTSEVMAYTPSLLSAVLAGQGFGSGMSRPVQVRVSVDSTAYANAAALADYADTLTLTIAP